MAKVLKKRYMVCSRCRGTAFEVYHEEVIHTGTQEELKVFSIDLGSHGITRLRCVHCGLENSTIAIFLD